MFHVDGEVDLPFDPEYTRHCTVFQIGGQIPHLAVSLWPDTNLTQLLPAR